MCLYSPTVVGNGFIFIIRVPCRLGGEQKLACMQMMEKLKNPLPKCSRCTKCEAPIISIKREQKAFCGLVFPAPWPLPLPQPPWQQKNIWESKTLNQEGDQLLVLSNQALPAPLHLAYSSLLIATYSLCNPEANAAFSSPPSSPPWIPFSP